MFFRKKVNTVSLAQEFNKACQLKMYTDSHFSDTFLKAASKAEYQRLWDLNFEIGAEEMIAMMGSFLDAELDEEESLSAEELNAKTLELADIYAAVSMRTFKDDYIRSFIPMKMKGSEASIEFAASGQKNIARLCLI